VRAAGERDGSLIEIANHVVYREGTPLPLYEARRTCGGPSTLD
jgi:hypothetical protein